MANTPQFDDDGDGDAVIHPASQPVFVFIKALRLEDWNHDTLVTWNKARIQYEQTARQPVKESRAT
ncbi:hypothetical protein PHMEG_00024147 [Phytophthora megakarya]|uniref:Uncharacterized protein n=1 Tax=Phytophthora megakarya TaxID=4795 RepID=A0A225VER3_9STRA|nr:hypothetical protein PHMEG_00024147 [Phytophthora megakarya]